MRKNWSKIAIVLVPEQPFRTKWGSIVKNWGVKLRFYLPRSNPFARNEVRSSKTEVKYGKIAIVLVPEQPFRTKWGSIVKNWGKIAIVLAPEQPFCTKWGSMRKNWGKIAIYLPRSNLFARNEIDRQKRQNWDELRFYLCRTCPEQPFRTKWGSMRKNWGKIAILLVPEQPFRTKRCSMCKNRGKIVI